MTSKLRQSSKTKSKIYTKTKKGKRLANANTRVPAFASTMSSVVFVLAMVRDYFFCLVILKNSVRPLTTTSTFMLMSGILS